MIPSYPSIYAIGHRALEGFLDDDVVVQEKVDGSQFSFGLLFEPDLVAPQNSRGENAYHNILRARSKGAELNIEAPDKMFAAGVAAVKAVEKVLHPGWVYRGEFLAKPHHNAIAYDRVPRNHVALFDVTTGPETYLDSFAVAEEAARLGFDVVPTLFLGRVGSPEMFRDLLEVVSFLGGSKVEGVVVKNYLRFGRDKKALMGKFVSEKYKEVHAQVWKENNPKQGDVLERLASKYTTAARWEKALQHLRDDGKIEDSPRDIGLLIREVWPDVERECRDDIADELYAWAAGHLRRMSTRGLAEWYKQRLMERQFEKETV